YPLAPAAVRDWYGVNALSATKGTNDGTGITIGIVDAFDDPSSLRISTRLTALTASQAAARLCLSTMVVRFRCFPRYFRRQLVHTRIGRWKLPSTLNGLMQLPQAPESCS